MIPQCNPKASYLTLKSEIDSAVARVLESGWYVLGAECESFDKEFAKYHRVPYGLGVASGTDALEIALRALGTTYGDKVITVSHTAVATVSAISRVGATPMFVDITSNFTMDPMQLEAVLKTQNIDDDIKAIIVVHLYGLPADMSAIMNVAEKFNVPVIEDCAQAHGAKLAGKLVGTFGIAGCFSFYPTKNLGALGDGGSIITQHRDFHEKCTLIRQYGWRERYISTMEGINSRLDEVQAAVLRVKLLDLDNSNGRRRDIANIYFNNLDSERLTLPMQTEDAYHVYHQFVIMCNNRDILREQLANDGVGTAIHYPLPVHQQGAYLKKKHAPLSLLKTEKVCKQILSLPMYPELTDNQAREICDKINSAIISVV